MQRRTWMADTWSLVQTTTMVLADLSAGNAKALYRRAQARHEPAASPLPADRIMWEWAQAGMGASGNRRKRESA
jgi:hypothetical protein